MKIGVFDSGYGGLTILKAIREVLPQYDYMYLGDNGAAPYGSRSFDIIYNYTWNAVKFLFEQRCALVIIACNTASAKALKNIQQLNLPLVHQQERHLPFARRVLGVIRPTVEAIPKHAMNIGVLATTGTVSSSSYVLELHKINPQLIVYQQACPLLVPLIEYNEYNTEGAAFFIDKYLNALFQQNTSLDTLILACTHYPIILPGIEKTLVGMQQSGKIDNIPVIITQGHIVAASLRDYLMRHSELRNALTTNGSCSFYTTETAEKFQESATIFIKHAVKAKHVHLS